jgi:putative membrane protein
MRTHIRFSLLPLLALATYADAQSFGNPAGLAPDTPGIETGQPKPDHANTADKVFVREVTLGGRAEVESGKLAESKATDDSVRTFAKRMVDDHRAANDRLKEMDDTNAVLPAELDAAHVAMLRDLDRHAADAGFDLAYISGQVADHQKTANLLLWQISSGQNEELRQYAMESLPVVLEHLAMAKELHAELTSAESSRQEVAASGDE